jgi:hypothetical protein
MNNNNNSENMVTKFVTDTIKFAAGVIACAIGGFVIFFLLFTPMFVPYFTGRICGELGCSENDSRVQARILPIKVLFWIICIASWSVILAVQVNINSNCPFR